MADAAAGAVSSGAVRVRPWSHHVPWALSTDPEPFDLAAFWQGLSSAGTYADSASPYGAVRMADGDSEIVLAYLFADIGLPPILAHYELIDGHWLVTWLQSGLACEDLRADILERVSTDTCPR